MKLFINGASPFARKVRIVAREAGLIGRIEEVTVVPVESAPELVAANPIAQIPALTDDDGVCWSDAALISARLDALAGTGLLPTGEAAWAVRRLEARGTGLLEMLVRMVLERRRPESEQSPFWLQRWEGNLMRAFAVAEGDCPEPDTLDLATITLGIAGTYTTFRYPHLDWRSVAPKIAALTDRLETRQSFIDTYPE